MIILDTNNTLIESCITSKYNSLQEEPNKLHYFEEFFSDFDRTTYKVNLKDKNSSTIQLSIKLNCIDQLKNHNLINHLQNIYGDLLLAEPIEGYSITLEVDLRSLNENFDFLLKKLSNLKRNCFASVFVKHFEMQKNGEASPVTRIDHRENESIFIKSYADHVTIVYSTQFRDINDLKISKVFMQEFVEARRKFENAPLVFYSAKSPPSEIADAAEEGDTLAYISFSLQPRHTNEKNREKSIDLIFMIRNYIFYHLKCTKAHLQMRMRAKCNDFTKVLNRAHMEEKRGNVVRVLTNDLSEL